MLLPPTSPAACAVRDTAHPKAPLLDRRLRRRGGAAGAHGLARGQFRSDASERKPCISRLAACGGGASEASGAGLEMCKL